MQSTISKHVYLSLFGLGLCGLCGLALEAAPVAFATIPGLVSSADIIVAGTVSSVQVPTPTSTGRLAINVDDVFKGKFTSGLDFSYEAQSIGTEQTLIGERVLAFGKLSGDGQSYALLPMAYGPGAPLREQVMEVGAAVAVPALQISTQDTPLQKMIKELGMIQIGSTTTKAAPYLLSLTSAKTEPDLTEAVFRAIQSSGPKGAAVGAAGLVAMGDINGLEAADSLDIQNHPELGAIISSIESSYKDTSQAGLQVLFRWLGPSIPAIKREAAAGALARIHTPGAVLQLGMALNDSDPEVRWRAIGGLSMFANNVPIGGVSPTPGSWPFRTADTIKFSAFDRNLIKKDEDSYLAFWRQWWNQNEAKIQTLAAAQAQ